MTIELFMILLIAGALISALITEAIKKAFYNKGKEAAPNLIALINAIVVGAIGTTVAYMLLAIPFTRNNIICLILMTVCIWLGSMLGFDKVTQLIEQIKRLFTGAKNDN